MSKADEMVVFLKGRVAADRRDAERVLAHEGALRGAGAGNVRYQWVMTYGHGSHGFHPGAPTPERVLADCALKEGLIQEWEEHREDTVETQAERGLYDLLKAMAAIYADHSAFKVEWFG